MGKRSNVTHRFLFIIKKGISEIDNEAATN